jgi:hypothetical protein
MNGNSAAKKCGVSQDIWVDYVEGELDKDLAHDMALHAKSCGECRRQLHGIRLVRAGLKTRSAEIAPKIMNDDLFFKRLEGKIMQAVEKTHIEPLAPTGYRHIKAIGVATAAMLVLIVGTPYLLPQLRLKPAATGMAHPPQQAKSLEDQLNEINSGTDPLAFGELLISHQDSDDFVLEAAAEKLSLMSDNEASSALDKMK